MSEWICPRCAEPNPLSQFSRCGICGAERFKKRLREDTEAPMIGNFRYCGMPFGKAASVAILIDLGVHTNIDPINCAESPDGKHNFAEVKPK